MALDLVVDDILDLEANYWLDSSMDDANGANDLATLQQRAHLLYRALLCRLHFDWLPFVVEIVL